MASVMDLNSADYVSTLIFGVAIPFGSLAVLVLGCGDNRRPAQKGKKKIYNKSAADRSLKTAKKKTGDPTKSGKQKQESCSLKTAKKNTVDPTKSGKQKQESISLGNSKKKVKRAEPVIKSIKPESEGLDTAKSPKNIKLSAIHTSKNSIPRVKGPNSSVKQSSSINLLPPNKPSKDPQMQMSSSGEQSQQSQKSSRELKAYANNHKLVTATKAIWIFSSEASQVTVEPHQLHFSPTGGREKITLSNISKEDRLAVKIKCSDNDVYHVNPVYAILEPGKNVFFDVYRNAAAAKLDKLVFLISKISKGESNPADTFKDRSKDFAQIVMPLVAIDEAKAVELNSCSRCVCVATR